MHLKAAHTTHAKKNTIKGHIVPTSQDVIVFQVILPFPVPDGERTFAIDDPDLPKLDKELHGDVALKLPPGFTVDQLK